MTEGGVYVHPTADVSDKATIGEGTRIAYRLRMHGVPRTWRSLICEFTAPTHFVDVTATLEAGIASLREHARYIEGLGREFDPDEFLRNMAGFIGLGAGCEYAVGFRRYDNG